MPAKINIPSETVQEMCTLFRSGTSIPELMSKFELSRNKITKTLRDALGEDYKSCAAHIITLSGKKAARKLRGRSFIRSDAWKKAISVALTGRKLPAETKAKIGESSRTRIERGTWTKEKQNAAYKKAVETKTKNGYYALHGKRHSEWMKKNAPMRGKKMTDESRQKMKTSRKRFFENGGKSPALGRRLSDLERKARSECTKRMWENGKFDYRKNGLFRSKMEISLFNAVMHKYHDAQHSFRITTSDRTYIFDIYVPALNLLIEFNGDYWHLNPSKYKSDFIDESRNVTAAGVWEADRAKKIAAIESGYRIAYIWESDIADSNVEEVLKKTLENYEPI